jgi:Rod binding domain-containing protein
MSDLSVTSEGRLPSVNQDEKSRQKKVANQFEASFIDLLFKDLERRNIDDEPLLGGDNATEQFTGLLHRGLSERSAGGLGIADMVMREMATRTNKQSPITKERRGSNDSQ